MLLESIALCALPVCTSVVQTCFADATPQAAAACPGNHPLQNLLLCCQE